MKSHTLLTDKELSRLAEAAAEEREREREREVKAKRERERKCKLLRSSATSMKRQKWILASEVAHSAHRQRVVEAS